MADCDLVHKRVKRYHTNLQTPEKRVMRSDNMATYFSLHATWVGGKMKGGLVRREQANCLIALI